MVTVAGCMQRGAELTGSDSAKLDVQLLLCHLLGCQRTALYGWPERSLSELEAAQFELLLQQRKAGTPMAYLLGQREFWSLKLQINNACLIPRPETESLVRAAIKLGLPVGARVLDLGCGSGAIALAIAHEQTEWQVQGVDIEPRCVSIAKSNAKHLYIENAEFACSDWFTQVAGKFHLIVSNPPYIPLLDPHLTLGDVRHEPRRALVAGIDGLDAIRHIVRHSPAFLRERGWLMIEHGYDQGDLVVAMLAGEGFSDVVCKPDEAGRDRFTVGCWSPV